jgi:hypothetical protein
MGITNQPGASEAEQRADQDHVVDGIRPGRFTGPGATGFGFDGDEPGPDDAANAETSQIHSRTDYSDDQERDDHGRFAGGGVGLEGHGTGSTGGVGRPGGESGPSAHKGEGGTAKSGGFAGGGRASIGAMSKELATHEAAWKEHLKDPNRDANREHGKALMNKIADLKEELSDAKKNARGPSPAKASNAAADKLTGEMTTHPFGFSWRPDTGHATSGIMVAEHPKSGSSHVIDFDKVTKESDVRKEVREYVAKHYDTIMKDPQLHFGGWKSTDEKTGSSKFYLDIARQHPKEDREGAIAEGVRHNQIAVWDIDNSAEIKTGGTGE